MRQPDHRPVTGQQIDIALRALAEGEILARDNAMRSEAVDQNVADEIAGIRSCQFGIEMEHQHRRCPGCDVEFLSLLQRGEAKGRRVWLEKSHRMGIECGDDGGTAFVSRPANGLACDLLMSEMETVEIAERDDRPAQRFGHGLTVIEPPHAGSSSAWQR